MKNRIASSHGLLALAATVLLAGSLSAQKRTDQDWPLSFTHDGVEVQVFKPQPESFDGTSFTARAAASVKRPTDEAPLFGAVWGNGVLAVDRTERMGTLTSFNVTDIRFPGLADKEERSQIQAILTKGITRTAPPISIDWLVAALEEEKQVTESYDNTPPEIIYREVPAILLFIDGDPILETKKASDPAKDPVYAAGAPEVERVVNTPFFVARPKGGSYWLYGSGLWYSAAKVSGPWKNEKKAPAHLETMAAAVDSSYTGERELGVIPEVVVRTKPAVLLDFDGKPQFQPYEKSSLMYATNTDKDLFLDIPTQEYYFLASGRWFATKNLEKGPWRHVAPDALPAGFAQVPEGSPKDGILAHVAGTDAAREAVRDASIPQTARVDRRTASTSVEYDGSPRFERITGTDVFSAVNASTVVLRIKDRYYVVDNAVWFEGPGPDGPWEVSTAVPAEVNSIPPSDPNYRVRYVYIYDHNPNVVFIGYTPGYLGAYVQGGTVIYGTGYYYNSWRSTYWYPRPYTWGFNMYYNPWYGWGFGASWGYNWFYPGWYNYHRPYSWGWWGPYAYCPPIATWYGHGHYWHGQYWTGSTYRGYYGHRPSVSQLGGSTRPAGRDGLRPTDLYRNRPTAGVTPSERTAGRTSNRTTKLENPKIEPRTDDRTRPSSGSDYFTDREGNVYRNNRGTTEKMQDGKWNTVPGKDSPSDKPSLTDRPTRDPGKVIGTQDRGSTVTRQERTDRVPPQLERGRTTPAPGSNDAGVIQRERDRATQRENDYRGYQQQRQDPAPRNTPNLTTRPQRSTAPPAAPSQVRPGTTPSRPAPSAPAGGGGSAPGNRVRR